ncbi:MAG: putative porin [Candidatus Omnitrophota bacterium]
MKSYKMIAILVALMSGVALPARADAPSELQAMRAALESMKLEMVKMHETIERQNARIGKLESARLAEASKPSVTLEPVKEKEMPAWLEGLQQAGDVRLRYEVFSRENEDSSDRNRFRFRLRWGVEKKFNDDWKAGFQFASGENPNEPVSTNQTLDDEFSLKDIQLQRAYALYTPTEHWKKVIPAAQAVEIGAGKVENPYDRDKWNSNIIWDSDVAPEGIYEKVDFRLAEPGKDAHWDLNTLMGQWVLNEDSDLTPGDREMISYGLGTTYQWAKDHFLSFKSTYYDWQGYAPFLKTSSVLSNALGGNDRELESFKILNFYSEIQWLLPAELGGFPFKVFGDYANNLGFQGGGSTDETLTNPALRGDSDDAFSIGATLGKAKDAGSWAFTYEYLYIEPNAVVGVFSESDLGVGFANNKGHRLRFQYKLLKDLELAFSAWLVERVDPTRLTYGSSSLRPNGDDDELLRTQLDLTWKF